MKKIVFAGLALAVSSVAAPALAADLPMKAPPMAAPVYNWNGWYGGVNFGYAGGNETDRELVVSGPGFPILGPAGAGTVLYAGPNNFRLSPQGVAGGAQAGYNWQTSTNIVLGVEADIQGSGIKGSIGCILGCGVPIQTVPGPFPLQFFPVTFTSDAYSHKIDWFGTVRGRVGYANGPTMVYLTGGLAYGDVQRSGNAVGTTVFNAFAGNYSASTTKVGWTVGVGGEAKLFNHPNWSIKGEYLYVDLGRNTDTFNTLFTAGGGGAVVGTVAGVRTDTSNNRDHVFRLGLNYSFNPTVVAKY
jgi:outer membrane immunogenic protein